MSLSEIMTWVALALAVVGIIVLCMNARLRPGYFGPLVSMKRSFFDTSPEDRRAMTRTGLQVFFITIACLSVIGIWHFSADIG